MNKFLSLMCFFLVTIMLNWFRVQMGVCFGQSHVMEYSD